MDMIQSFFHGLKTKKTAFIGVGVSHTDLIKMFLSKGLDVTVCDKKSREAMKEYDELSAAGAKFELGEGYLDGIESGRYDVVFRTPGMYYLSPVLTAARQHGTVVTSEMEVFFDLCPCPIYALTGSDGKTTTTTIVAELFAHEGKRVHKGGNIGRALLPIIEDITPDDVAVVELSSFQLISMRSSPQYAAITNITPNHLNVHKDMQEYIDSKANILLHQNAFSVSVLSYDNQTARDLSPLVRGDLRYFSRFSKVDNGAYLDGDMLVYNDHGTVTPIVDMHDIRIPGMHNVENYLTTIALTHGKIALETVRTVAKEFGGVEHRIELVRELDGVKYYNNSIASSPTRVIACLNTFEQKQIMIMGGSDKGISFDPMAELVCEKVKLLILLGQTKFKIRDAVMRAANYTEGNPEMIVVDTMDEAVKTAHDRAVSGDIVSLSPACASFDMYRMFEERGDHFKSLVKAL
ncbi:MAG: UDP-N-acetylmuramoyl-L-alanine--D-glutamate ligase [Oscillospiraceae bacterium]|nr:UDP-N-acetylmuramoyl-L-alanine--D-glutamate ligase [Oscillospiraceae bacterium]